MLEQQQLQLVAGLQETYHQLRTAGLWPGSPLVEPDDVPLTHDILERLDLLLPCDTEVRSSEQDVEEVQEAVTSPGAISISSGPTPSSSQQRCGATISYERTPDLSRCDPGLEDSFDSTLPPLKTQSTQLYESQHCTPVELTPNDNEFSRRENFSSFDKRSEDNSDNNNNEYLSDWPGMSGVSGGFGQNMMRSQYALRTPSMQDGLYAMTESWHCFTEPTMQHVDLATSFLLPAGVSVDGSVEEWDRLMDIEDTLSANFRPNRYSLIAP